MGRVSWPDRNQFNNPSRWSVGNESFENSPSLIPTSFRWVDCQLREIAACPRTEEHLDKLLVSLPRTLDDTYEQMLLAIPPAFKDYARQMLMLLCCAKRYLTVEELIYGMAVDLDTLGSKSDNTILKDTHSDLPLEGNRPVAVFKDKRKLHDADAVLEVCPGFVELYEGREGSSYVRIAHFSVQEYLKSSRTRKRENVARYHMQDQDMNTQATRICLAILDKFDESAALQEPNPSNLFQMGRPFPWAFNAAEFWSYHFRESNEIPPEAISAMLRLRPYAFGISVSRGLGLECGYTPLHLATSYELTSVVSVLLQEPTTDIDKITFGMTALIVAVIANNVELARCLLGHDADVNSRGGYALTTAAGAGQVEMSKILLEYGAEVNAHGGRALTTAVETGHLKIAKLLLDHGAEINPSGGKALKTAVSRGHLEMVKILLEGGADVNLVRPNFSPMKPELVRVLLEHGVEINQYDDFGETVLHKAARAAAEDTVRLLLEYGAEVDLANNENRTALLQAARFGNKKNALLLLERGAKPDAVDKFGDTAVSLAAESGCKDLVTFLSNLQVDWEKQ